MQGEHNARVSRRQLISGLAAGIGLTAAGSVLAACASAPAPAPTSAPAQPAPTSAPAAAAPSPKAESKPAASSGKKLSVWTVKMFTPAANDHANKLLTEYAKANSWDIELSETPTDLMPKLLAGVESGIVPDLVQLSTQVASFHGTDALTDVSSIVKELEDANGPATALARSGAIYKSKWFAVPWFSYTDGWYARKDVYAKNNLKFDDLKTYDQWRDAALQVSDPDNQMWGWGQPGNSSTGDGRVWTRHYLNCAGCSITDESGEKVILDTPQTADAVAWMADIFLNPKWKKMLPPGIMAWNDAGNNEHMIGGKISFTMNSSGLYWAAKNQNSPYFKEIAIRSFPLGPSGKELVGGYAFYHVVFSKAKNKDFALQTSKFMSEKKQALERAVIAEGQGWPLYKNLLESNELKEFIKTDPGYEQLLKNANHPSGWAVGWPGPLTPGSSAVDTNSIIPKMVEAVIAGTLKPAEAVKEAHKACEDIFKQFKS